MIKNKKIYSLSTFISEAIFFLSLINYHILRKDNWTKLKLFPRLRGFQLSIQFKGSQKLILDAVSYSDFSYQKNKKYHIKTLSWLEGFRP